MSTTQPPKRQASGERERRPESELDVYDKIVSSTVDDGLLASTNLGLGNLDDGEYYQQVESFRFAQFADSAFTRKLMERAIKETVQELAKQGWSYEIADDNGDLEKEVSLDGLGDLDEEVRAEKDRREWIRDQGAEMWEELPQSEQLEAMQEFAGMSDAWKPPHWKMIQMRNEASRSRGARLMDNAFGRVREVKNDAEQTVKDALRGEA